MAARGKVRANGRRKHQTANEAPDTALPNPVARFLKVVDGVELCGFRLIEFLDRIAVRLLLFILLTVHFTHLLKNTVPPNRISATSYSRVCSTQEQCSFPEIHSLNG